MSEAFGIAAFLMTALLMGVNHWAGVYSFRFRVWFYSTFYLSWFLFLCATRGKPEMTLIITLTSTAKCYLYLFLLLDSLMDEWTRFTRPPPLPR